MTALTDYQQNLAVGTEMTSKIKEEVDEIVNQLEDKLSTLCRTVSLSQDRRT